MLWHSGISMPADRICQKNSSLLTTRRYSSEPLSFYANYEFNVCNFFLQPFFSLELDVMWPEISSSEAELRPGGNITVRSEEGRALLDLSPSGKEFFVEFTCSLSRPPNQQQNVQSLHKDAQEKVILNICVLTSQIRRDNY